MFICQWKLFWFQLANIVKRSELNKFILKASLGLDRLEKLKSPKCGFQYLIEIENYQRDPVK